MAITSITIENFKGIGDAVTIPIRPITLLFGKNSSGKSTVLQALHYMREVCEHAGADPDRTHIGGDYIDLGGFRSLVHLHQLDRKIRIRIEFGLTSEDSKNLNIPLKHERNLDSAWIEVVTSWNTKENKVYTELYEYGINGIELLRIVPIKKIADGLNDVGWRRLGSTIFLYTNHPDITDNDIADYLKKTINNEDNEEALWYIPRIALKELHDIRYLGPMRKVPSRDYRPQKTPNESLWAEGLEAWNTLGRNPELVKKINRYMQDVLKLGYSISRQEIILLDRDDEIMENGHPSVIMKLHDKVNDIYLDLIDVGLGISQVIPVLVGALHSGPPDLNRGYLSKPSGGLFAVEQPELHLHPAAQVALGDTFIDSIKYNRYHPVQVALKRIMENIEDNDHFKEFFEFMKENSEHSDIQEEADRIINILNNSNDSDLEEAMVNFIENIRENRDHSDIQLALKKYLEKIDQEAFEEFSYSIKNSSYRTILIETHSEHLLLRLLRRVRETTEGEQIDHTLTPDDLSVVYVRPTPEGIKFTPISVMDDGGFYAPWPEGFFAERVKELF